MPREPVGKTMLECFVIMPISGTEDRNGEHFMSVYRDIIAPACKVAGFTPIRADDIKSTNLIHVDILKRIVEAPLAICDLSTRNPNVLFELGIRQAFDMPVVLIQEKNTKRIFDINLLRIYEYSPTLIYQSVLEDQKEISDIINKTMEGVKKSDHINSLIRLMSLPKAADLKNAEIGSKQVIEIVEMLKSEIHEIRRTQRRLDLETRESSRRRKYNEIKGPEEFFELYERFNLLFQDYRMRDEIVPIDIVSKIKKSIHESINLFLNDGRHDFRAARERMEVLLSDIDRHNKKIIPF